MKDAGLRFLMLLVAITSLSVFGFGQGTSTGSIAGTVTDPTTAVVSGATVTIKNNATGQEFTAVTTDNGTFNVPAVQSGTYTVTVTAPGFKQAIVQDAKVDVGSPSTVNVALEIGAQTESITIVGTGAELINAQNATVGTTITGRQIVEQPQASRDALDLITLLPGVQTTGRPRTSTVNGLPKGSLNITLDGTDVQDNLINSNDGFFTFVRPRIDAVGEVTISTATPGAESSGDGAVQIKFVTRGGTNDLEAAFTGTIASRRFQQTTSLTIKPWRPIRSPEKLPSIAYCSISMAVVWVGQSAFPKSLTVKTKRSFSSTTKSFDCLSSSYGSV